MVKHVANTMSWKSLWFMVMMAVIVSAIAFQMQPLSADAEDASSHRLEGTEWVLASLGGKEALAGTEITALFEESGVAGSAGCNSFFAGYESDGNGLVISPAGMTMMMCPGPDGVMEQEMVFGSALGSVNAYRIAADALEITYDGGTMIFTAK